MKSFEQRCAKGWPKRIDYSAYILKKVGVNSSRVGSLLRIEWQEAFGYADLHPWPEFGDFYIKEQLKTLADFQKSPTTIVLPRILQRSLYFSQRDAQARFEKKSLFEDIEVPDSHYLITREDEVAVNHIEKIIQSGFTKIKVKIGGDPLMAAVSISQLASYLVSIRPLQLRLDVNARWSVSEFKEFIEKIPADLKSIIEFIEDPFHSAPELWPALSRQYAVSFARDFADDLERDHLDYRVRILKPAVADIQKIAEAEAEDVRFVVTSYLDHPVGQVCAAFEAAELKKKYGNRVLQCGLLSQNAYEQNDFSEQMAARGPKFPEVGGHGFGFDEILTNIRWQQIK